MITTNNITKTLIKFINNKEYIYIYINKKEKKKRNWK